MRGTLAVGKYWHEFDGDDLIATIDFGKETDIHFISLGCLQHYKDWIFMPQYAKFETSLDGIYFTDAGTVKNDIAVDDKNAIIKDFTINLAQQKVQYIRITAKNLGVCPQGHPGAEQSVWLFADEIIVQ